MPAQRQAASLSAMAMQSALWQSHPGLVWSNPEADDCAHIRAALLRPRFERLLDVAVAFGLDRLRSEWAVLRTEGTTEVVRAQNVVERILNNIEKGFAIATARN